MEVISYNYCRKIMLTHTLIIIICLFLAVYIYINYNEIAIGNYYSGNISKTIIISGGIFLVFYIFFAWDSFDDNFSQSSESENIVHIPKYKIVNKTNIEPIKSDSNKNIQIENKYMGKLKTNSVQPNEISSIFVPQKNRGKFGIKF